MRYPHLLFIIAVLFGGSAATASAAPIVAGSFSTTWDGGDSSVIQIDLGACPTAVYWEELGNESNNGTSTVCVGSEQTITFPYAGQYRVDFSGNFTQIGLGDDFNRGKFRSVEQWGDSVWTTFRDAFYNVQNLSIPAIDAPNLSLVTDMSYMFQNATDFNSSIDHWDVSNVTDMIGLFKDATSFNQPLNSWNVSSVLNMGYNSEGCDGVFTGAATFNQPLDSWDVSSVTDMSCMFRDASSFDQQLNTWDVSQVESMYYMFNNASAFNQPLDAWDVTGTSDFRSMFDGAIAFDQLLGDWEFGTACAFLNDDERFFVWQYLFPIAHACVYQSIELDDMFINSGISIQKYSDTIAGWSTLAYIPLTKNLGSVPVGYCDTIQTQRDILTTTYSWVINDLGPEPCPEEVTESSSDSTNGTKVGLRKERLEAIREAVVTASSTSASERFSSFVSALKNLIDYLTENESMLETLSPEEAKTVIMTLRDAVLQLLRFLPGV